ncbi:MAG TPA: D-alanyl-D-alanine carboxypeptidase/D-alanyl-D-alanine-endopeptidase [Streptosporangiaceae bacterium]|nr:D-alanyl-D-alanine carboxypeptidase/D-alanyl-D-alanine-endopeptidase [Streptosporangiaceae bacterium]
MNRQARMTVLTMALLCVFTICAGAAVAALLPPRLALFQMPQISGEGLAPAGHGLVSAQGPQAGRPGLVTAAGVSARIAGLVGGGGLGPDVGALVADLTTGKVLFSQNAAVGFTPASTTKLATAVAAIDTLGADAKFTTSVTLPAGQAGTPGSGGQGRTIVLVGGGDPVLAAGPYPAGSYPQPATLTGLAARTAAALRARRIATVRLRYDASLFGGPTLAPGWPAFGAADNYVTTGNMTIITGLEVDQGRLTASGKPEDADDTENFRPRSMTPARQAAGAFAAFLRKDGITVHGAPAATTADGGTTLAAVHSPPLTAIVQQMLSESNNVIAETLARHVAIATGRPATFGGAADAVMATDRGLGIDGIHIYDGSGLSPLDEITPRALVGLVRLAAEAGPGPLRAVITGMPVAGFSGTLGPGSVFGPFGSAALGTVRAKTGNLTGVATMAGIAYTASGQLLAFAFMANKIPARLGLQPESALAGLATALAGCGCR